MGRAGTVVLVVCAAACAPAVTSGSAIDAGRGSPDAAAVDAGTTMASCTAGSADLQSCTCDPSAGSRACYPGSAPPATRHVGACQDGTQACVANGELSQYGPCTGAVTPVAEICTNHIDDSCDGTTDCADPTCATSPACASQCTDGMTRSCYDGPTGTSGVGTCRNGTQTCAGGAWPTTCPGEVLPQAEDCTGPEDRNCNYLPGCFDFTCILSPACNSPCKVTSPDCVCPMGSGDVATCPDGTYGVDTPGTFSQPDSVQCCPCTASTCGNPGCCGEAVCAGSSMCAGLTCNPLPAMCNGQVSFDCDDFPEDCDEPCCKCTSCSSTGN